MPPSYVLLRIIPENIWNEVISHGRNAQEYKSVSITKCRRHRQNGMHPKGKVTVHHNSSSQNRDIGRRAISIRRLNRISIDSLQEQTGNVPLSHNTKPSKKRVGREGARGEG